jgi:thiamine biosynthesis lipoprotein
MRLQRSNHALGSEVLLTLVGSDQAALEVLFEQLWHEVSLFEQTFSRFLEDSELSAVNRSAGLPVPVSPEFRRLAETARDISLATEGLYDPFMLPALQQAGYVGSWPSPAVSAPGLDYRDRKLASAKSMVLDPDTICIPAQTALDFGGIGKGYLLDVLAEQAVRAGCDGFCFSLGGDIVVQGCDVDESPWHVDIAWADDGDGTAAEVVNDDGGRLAVATSGTIKRRGPGWHHLIDPRTGKPAVTDLLTATVMTSSATEADVYAKCLVLLGSAEATDFMERLRIDRAVLQSQDTHGVLQIDVRGI